MNGLGWLEWLVNDTSLGVVFFFFLFFFFLFFFSLMEWSVPVCGTVGMEGEVCPGEGS